MTNETTCRWDFFFRAEVNAATLRKLGITFDQHWADRPANFVRLDLPATLTVEQAFAAAIATGKVPTGGRAGLRCSRCRVRRHPPVLPPHSRAEKRNRRSLTSGSSPRSPSRGSGSSS